MDRLYKNSNDKMIFGGCSGLADYLGITSIIVRLLTVAGVFFSLSLVFWIYLLLAIILPQKNKNNTGV